MGLPERATVTEAEYLRLELESLERHEFFDGVITAMSGGSPRHNLIVSNLHTMLGNAMKGRRCTTLPEGQRIFSPATGLYTYADALIVCDNPRFHAVDGRSLTNPQAIFEVLSPSTEGYDRGAKFAHYQSLESLREFVLIEQRQMRVDHFLRQDDGRWLLTNYAGNEAIVALPTLSIALPLKELYERMELFPADPERPPPDER